MKPSEKLVKATAYVAGILAVASALLMIVFIVLAELGCINPRKIKLVATTESVTREYDGTTLVGDVDITYGKLAPGHSIDIIKQSSIVKVGEVKNEVEFLIVDSTGADVTELYDIELDTGTLTVKERELYVMTDSSIKKYDGTELKDDNIYVKKGSIADGDEIKVISSASITDVGTIDNVAVYCITSKNGEDVTDQYSIVEEWGELIVTKISITVKTNSSDKYYDGTPLENLDFSVTRGALAQGHTLQAEKWATLDYVGTIDNNIEFAVYDAKGVDVTQWYNISVVPGSLTLNGRSITVVTGDMEKEYDGTPASNLYWFLSRGTLDEGEKLVAAESTSFSGVGTVDNVIRFLVINAQGVDVTPKYDIDYSYGKLTVTPRALTIKTGDARKTYDGKPLSNNKYTVQSGSLCNGHVLDIVCRSRTEVGWSSNEILSYTIKVTQADGTVKDVSDCYKITYDSGSLRVDPPK